MNFKQIKSKKSGDVELKTLYSQELGFCIYKLFINDVEVALNDLSKTTALNRYYNLIKSNR